MSSDEDLRTIALAFKDKLEGLKFNNIDFGFKQHIETPLEDSINLDSSILTDNAISNNTLVELAELNNEKAEDRNNTLKELLSKFNYAVKNRLRDALTIVIVSAITSFVINYWVSDVEDLMKANIVVLQDISNKLDRPITILLDKGKV